MSRARRALLLFALGASRALVPQLSTKGGFKLSQLGVGTWQCLGGHFRLLDLTEIDR